MKIIGLLVLGAVLQWLLINLAQKKKLFQNIYTLSPKTHQEKSQTPSLGGIGIMIGLVVACISIVPSSSTLYWILATVLAFALIGAIDDIQSLIKKENKGLSAKDKFRLQWTVSLLSILAYHTLIAPLSVPYSLLAVFLLLATPNACNLSDGLDGLLAGLTLISLAGFAAIFYVHNTLELYPLIVASIVAILPFFIANRNPAKIFMGDTGSLGIGALLACIAIATNPFWLIWVGAIYIIETLSVIIQVAVFKRTKRRVFLMAPLHHHFELLGLSERQVVMLFWLISAGLIAIAIYIGTP